MPSRRRLLLAISAAAVIALPAAVLAGLCKGNACRREEAPTTRVPFCSLPEEARSLVAAGFREGRSPHVLALGGESTVVGSSISAERRWPSLKDVPIDQVPLVFAGMGVSPGAAIPTGTRLDAVAPTVAEVIGFDRGHPGVRSGEPVSGVASGTPPRLVLLVTWKEVSAPMLERHPRSWPNLRGLMDEGAGTMAATAGSLPTDPPAILTTIGTGAIPRDHGITGSILRNEQGAVVEPWRKGAPFSVVATLADDLDDRSGQAARIGLIGSDASDLGLIGGNWYIEHDRDDVIIEPDLRAQSAAATSLLASGYGADATTDLLAIAMAGSTPKLDAALGSILEAAGTASGDSVLAVVTATGANGGNGETTPIEEIESDVEATLGADVIEASTPGGIFLDQQAMTETGLSDDRVVNALRRIRTSDARPLFADVFPAIAVTFARYC